MIIILFGISMQIKQCLGIRFSMRLNIAGAFFWSYTKEYTQVSQTYLCSSCLSLPYGQQLHKQVLNCQQTRITNLNNLVKDNCSILPCLFHWSFRLCSQTHPGVDNMRLVRSLNYNYLTHLHRQTFCKSYSGYSLLQRNHIDKISRKAKPENKR